VNSRNVPVLGARLLPHVRALGDEPALSPDASPPPEVPVFLLHGSEDNVVPATETAILAEYVKSRTRARVLLTPLISHAEVDRPASTREIWNLISFWKDMLEQ
jgi:predicted esterase